MTGAGRGVPTPLWLNIGVSGPTCHLFLQPPRSPFDPSTGSGLTAFSISISYLLNVHPCRQRVADLLRNKGRRAATPCRQR